MRAGRTNRPAMRAEGRASALAERGRIPPGDATARGGSPRLFRADLHVHTRYSGLKQLPFLRMRDCCSDPEEAYRAARKRGMDLVALTDHDTIDGARELLDKHRELPGLLVGEEVSVVWRERRVGLHVNVFDIDEEDHREIQKARGNLPELLACLRSRGIPFALNHLFREAPIVLCREYLEQLVSFFDLFEVRNACQTEGYASLSVRAILALRTGPPPGFLGGSDAHTPRRAGCAFTASAAGSREEFLRDLSAGRIVALGEGGSVLPLGLDVWRICLAYYGTILKGGERDWRWRDLAAGGLFTLGTLPGNLIAFPILATGLHAAATRARLVAIQRILRLTSSRPLLSDAGRNVSEEGTPGAWANGAEAGLTQAIGGEEG